MEIRQQVRSTWNHIICAYERRPRTIVNNYCCGIFAGNSYIITSSTIWICSFCLSMYFNGKRQLNRSINTSVDFECPHLYYLFHRPYYHSNRIYSSFLSVADPGHLVGGGDFVGGWFSRVIFRTWIMMFIFYRHLCVATVSDYWFPSVYFFIHRSCSETTRPIFAKFPGFVYSGVVWMTASCNIKNRFE